VTADRDPAHGEELDLQTRAWRALYKASARATERLHQAFQRRLRPPGGDVESYTSRGELLALYELASACPRGGRALEIGSHLGASAVALAAGLARVDGRLYCVDTWDNETMPEGRRDTLAEFRVNVARYRDRIVEVRKRSADLTPDDAPGPFDLVFLDGDHSYESVRADFALIGQWVAPSGTVAFHDFGTVHFPGVSRVVGAALASGEWRMAALVERLACLRRADWVAPDWLSRP
jgi:predicted O-methyltransferase YrrM